MKSIGLTGGIATGKSTVADMLGARGAAIVDADLLAREVVRAGQPALAEIVTRFGAGMLAPDGSLDRSALGEVVFGDEASRRDLEAITHPRIDALMVERVAAARAGGYRLVVVDVPLLFERGIPIAVDGVLVVYAPPPVQATRLSRRDRLSAAAAGERIAAQMAIDEKRSRATWVIDNGRDLEHTRAQVDRWWETFVSECPS